MGPCSFVTPQSGLRIVPIFFGSVRRISAPIWAVTEMLTQLLPIWINWPARAFATVGHLQPPVCARHVVRESSPGCIRAAWGHNTCVARRPCRNSSSRFLWFCAELVTTAPMPARRITSFSIRGRRGTLVVHRTGAVAKTRSSLSLRSSILPGPMKDRSAASVHGKRLQRICCRRSDRIPQHWTCRRTIRIPPKSARRGDGIMN